MAWTKNFGHPQGWLGKLILNSMNLGHGPVSKWGLSLYDWQKNTTALDIGCGGGMNLKRMLALAPEGAVCGVDVSQESVRKSRMLNGEEEGKRLLVREGTAEALPFPDHVFDVATAFETVYFWTDVGMAFSEAARVLKPGGRLMIVCEMTDPNSFWKNIVKEMNLYTEEQLVAFFRAAGFVKIDIEKKRSWCCVYGETPKEAITTKE